MKALSIIVPCYNSSEYVSTCVESLLACGKDIEILLINDGSTDSTKYILDMYEKKYAGTVRAIHQENKGHGGAINTGIAKATGKFIKVVDSDDWVNSDVLRQIVEKLETFIETDQQVDQLISNFIYDKVGAKKKQTMSYAGILPVDRLFGWEDIGRFGIGKYILMHSVVYSMEVLRKSQLSLPQHTFYVDNLFVYLPLEHVHTMYYMDLCLYHYYIGREDQSVNEATMIKRIDQQLKVNKLMMDHIDFSKIEERNKRRYMINYLNIITTVSSMLLIKSGTNQDLDKKRILWKYLRNYDYAIYWRLKTSLLGNVVNLPGVAGRKVSLYAYKLAQQIIGFN